MKTGNHLDIVFIEMEKLNCSTTNIGKTENVPQETQIQPDP